tara:strand:+ start:359 stop:904 length:546 start_codon:yes stop_codon:yes gene_type:complete
MSYKHGWYDPSNSGFHSKKEKDHNRTLRDQIDSLAKNFTGTDGWGAGQSYADGVYGGGKYKHNLMNDEYLGHIIGYLESNQKKAAAPASAPKPVPIKRSEEVATAIGRAKAYEDNLLPRYGDYLIAGDESVIDDFKQDTIDNTEEASKPYFEADVDRVEAQKYADKYKLELGKGLKLTSIA